LKLQTLSIIAILTISYAQAMQDPQYSSNPDIAAYDFGHGVWLEDTNDYNLNCDPYDNNRWLNSDHCYKTTDGNWNTYGTAKDGWDHAAATFTYDIPEGALFDDFNTGSVWVIKTETGTHLYRFWSNTALDHAEYEEIYGTYKVSNGKLHLLLDIWPNYLINRGYMDENSNWWVHGDQLRDQWQIYDHSIIWRFCECSEGPCCSEYNCMFKHEIWYQSGCTNPCPSDTYYKDGNKCMQNDYLSTCSSTCDGTSENCPSCTCSSTLKVQIEENSCQTIGGCYGTTPGRFINKDDGTLCDDTPHPGCDQPENCIGHRYVCNQGTCTGLQRNDSYCNSDTICSLDYRKEYYCPQGERTFGGNIYYNSFDRHCTGALVQGSCSGEETLNRTALQADCNSVQYCEIENSTCKNNQDPYWESPLPNLETHENIGIQNDIINLDTYASDYETTSSGLTYLINKTIPSEVNCEINPFDSHFLDITPAQDWSGTAECCITISDGINHSNEDCIDIVVNQNNPPNLNLPIPNEEEIYEDSGIHTNKINLFNHFDDDFTPNNNLIFHITSQNPSEVECTVTNQHYISYTPYNNWTGTASCCILASDRYKNSSPDCFNIPVSDINDPPTITSINIETPLYYNYDAKCNITAEDIEDDSISFDYQWKVNSINRGSNQNSLEDDYFNRGDLVECYATPIDEDIGTIKSASTIPLGYPPILNDILDNSPVMLGKNISFTSFWTDFELDSSILKICKDINCEDIFCQSTSETISPATCSFKTSNANEMINNYFAIVCNNNGEGCSNIENGTFVVNKNLSLNIPNQEITFNSSIELNLHEYINNPYEVSYNITKQPNSSFVNCTIAGNTLHCTSQFYGNTIICINASNGQHIDQSCSTININPKTDYILVIDGKTAWSEPKGTINITNFLNTSKCNESYCNITLEFYSRIKEKKKLENLEIYFTALEKLLSYNITLTKGWNLISIPLETENKTLSSVLKLIAGNHKNTFTYLNNKWTRLDNSSEVNHSIGLWINMLNEDTLTIKGKEIANYSFTLSPGKNLIGYPNLNITPINETLNISGLTTIFMFNNSKWYSYDPKRPPALNTLNKLTPGFGYIVKTK